MERKRRVISAVLVSKLIMKIYFRFLYNSTSNNSTVNNLLYYSTLNNSTLGWQLGLFIEETPHQNSCFLTEKLWRYRGHR